MALAAIFIEVSLIRLGLLRKSWESKFKYCQTASNYRLPNNENPTFALRGKHAAAHHSSADLDSGLWFMMSCRLLNNDML